MTMLENTKGEELIELEELFNNLLLELLMLTHPLL